MGPRLLVFECDWGIVVQRVARAQSLSMVSRRDFLRVGSLSVVGLSVAERAALAAARSRSGPRSVILLLMTGGPSQFETFDPKPTAPVGIRGPLRSIPTAVPGVALSDSLPRLAERLDRFALIRSLTHDAAPIHETGLQLLQTGRLARGTLRSPSYGSAVSHLLGPRDSTAPYVVLPRLVSNTGVATWQGQTAGCLPAEFDPLTEDAELLKTLAADEPESMRRTYGETRFGELCLQARKLVECGVRCVTVNLFDSLAGEVTWDCHARGPSSPATLYDYRDFLCPQFDRAVSALLDDLAMRGLLENTLVVATGEFGRTPQINENGGRDHWTSCWSGLVAGAGVQGGAVIGSSDSHGAEPLDRPVALGELTATIYHALGIDLEAKIPAGDGQELPLTDHKPITELFG